MLNTYGILTLIEVTLIEGGLYLLSMTSIRVLIHPCQSVVRLSNLFRRTPPGTYFSPCMQKILSSLIWSSSTDSVAIENPALNTT